MEETKASSTLRKKNSGLTWNSLPAFDVNSLSAAQTGPWSNNANAKKGTGAAATANGTQAESDAADAGSDGTGASGAAVALPPQP